MTCFININNLGESVDIVRFSRDSRGRLKVQLKHRGRKFWRYVKKGG